MKRQSLVLALFALFSANTMAYAQQRSPTPPGQRGGGTADSPVQPQLFELLKLFESEEGRRGGGGRGSVDTGTETQLRELERYINRSGGPVIVTVASGAWWTNATLVNQLGLSEDQKAKIEKTFENHRLNLESSKALLEKEEARLARLLEAETIDRNASLAQIYRVVNARGEMERVNAAMTLEMREHLTRAQWVQLQSQSVQTIKFKQPAPARGQ